jgi:hypothetical protein
MKRSIIIIISGMLLLASGAKAEIINLYCEISKDKDSTITIGNKTNILANPVSGIVIIIDTKNEQIVEKDVEEESKPQLISDESKIDLKKQDNDFNTSLTELMKDSEKITKQLSSIGNFSEMLNSMSNINFSNIKELNSEPRKTGSQSYNNSSYDSYTAHTYDPSYNLNPGLHEETPLEELQDRKTLKYSKT